MIRELNQLNQVNNEDNQQDRHNQVRQNFIQNRNQHVIPVGQQFIIVQPIAQDRALHNPHQFPQANQFRQAILDASSQRSMIPLIPISGYKYYLQICLLFGCFIQASFFRYTYLHFLWILWYTTLGYWRHSIVLRKIRFYAQLFNLIIWITVNFYVFGISKKDLAVTPFLILLVNLDFYFIGSGLFLTYFCFFSYKIYSCVASIRLRRIEKQLQQRKAYLIKSLLQKFIVNQKTSIGVISSKNDTTQQSINESEQQQVNRHKIKFSQNSCSICLDELVIGKNVDTQKIILKLDCDHRYHWICIKEWIQTDNLSCPICRRNIVN